MVKSIIKRIIVGVGIALCLMYIKGGLIGTVQAMEIQKATPSGIAYTPHGGSATSLTMGQISPSGLQVPIYAANTNFSQMTQVDYFYFNFSNNSSLNIDQSMDMHFLLYSSGFFTQYDDNPYQIFIRTGYNDTATVYTCQVDPATSTNYNSGTQPNTVIGYFSNVYCNNIALNAKNFRIFLLSQYFVPSGTGTVGISSVTLYPHNSNQSVVNAIDENTQATEDVNNSLNDESDANTSSFLEDVNQDYSNNPVSDLITMPITFLQRLNNNINGSCITWNLGSLLGTNLTMPCINLQQILGSTLYNLIDMAICLFLAYNLGLMCVTIWNNMTSLKDDFDDMYSPRHAYNGKHTGGGS